MQKLIDAGSELPHDDDFLSVDDIGLLLPNFGDKTHGDEVASPEELESCSDVSDLT